MEASPGIEHSSPVMPGPRAGHPFRCKMENREWGVEASPGIEPG